MKALEDLQDIISNPPWGSHFCQFYSYKEDYLPILTSYIKSGLQNNEACLWIHSDYINKREAINLLYSSIDNVHHYLEKGQLKLISYDQWYIKDNNFHCANLKCSFIFNTIFKLS